MSKDNLFIGCNGQVSALDPETGTELWRTPLSPSFKSGVATTDQDVTVLAHGARSAV